MKEMQTLGLHSQIEFPIGTNLGMSLVPELGQQIGAYIFGLLRRLLFHAANGLTWILSINLYIVPCYMTMYTQGINW